MDKKVTLRQYMDYRFKQIQDVINDHINGKKVNQLDLLNNEVIIKEIDNQEKRNIEIEGEIKNKIKAADVVTDSNHRYISDSDLDRLKENVSRTELNAAIDDVTNNLKLVLNEQVDNILNNKDSIKAINIIKKIISDNNGLLSLFKILATNEDLDHHAKNGLHITKEDREALNKLLKTLNDGYADYTASEGEVGYIKNKPDSLPANGGNADTVGGYCADKLINKQPEKYIIGINTANTYDKSKVNILLTNDTVNKLNNYFVENTATCLREGEYNPKTISLAYSNTLYGVGFPTIIKDSKIFFNDNCIVKDITFRNCIVEINSKNNNIFEVNFENCDIILNETSLTYIQKCRFNKCKFKFGKCFNNIISNNILIGSDKIKYYGGNNIIKDNIYV